MRVWQSLPHARVGELRTLGIRSGFGSPRLRIGYLKAFMDGALGSGTALLLDGSGVRITGGEELAEIVRLGAEAGLPLAVHAIGDGANREALDALEQTRAIWEPLGLRHRIEHAQLLAPEDLPRFAELGIAASVQFSHAPSDRDLADRSWGDRPSAAYAYRSLVDSGAVVANGSDAPIEELDPLAGIRAGVRRTIDERAAWHPEEALTVQQALRGDDRRAGVALRRRAPAGQVAAGVRGRSRRPRPRPVGRPRCGGRRDDGRRPLGAQPAALGLTPKALRLGSARSGREPAAAAPAMPGSRRAARPPEPPPGWGLARCPSRATIPPSRQRFRAGSVTIAPQPVAADDFASI